MEVIKVYTYNQLILNNDVFCKAIAYLWFNEYTDCIFIPKSNYVEVRYKNLFNGKCETMPELPIYLYEEMMFNLKLSLNVSVFESKISSNNIFFSFENELIGIRCSIQPMFFAQCLSLRIIKENFKINMDANIVDSICNSKGITLIAGTTGSGKTTFLYSLLNSIKNKLIATVEDPIEMILPHIMQSEVNSFISYDEAVKSLLRHTPDIMVLGEIRDSYSANALIRASYSGHKIISTIHANSVEGVMSRLENLINNNVSHLINNVVLLNNFIPSYYDLTQKKLNL